MSLNHIVIMGRLTRDPELRRTGQGTAVTSFTLAVDRDFSGKDSGQKETDFIVCVAWRNTAEFVNNYFRTGRMAVVSGRLQIRTWKDKDGNNRKTAEVIAENVYFGDSKPEGSQGGYTAPAGGYSNPGYNNYGQQNSGYSGNQGGYGGGYSVPAAPESDFAMLDDDEAQLPF